MKVQQAARRVTCPRCDAPVTGDFKFCPACAYRLRPGVPVPEAPPVQGSRLGTALLFLGAGALLAGLVGFGVLLFGDRGTATVPRAGPGRLTRPLTVGDIPSTLVDLPPGMIWRKDTPSPDKVDAVRFMKYEVTRGQWAEFVRDLQAHPERVPAFLREWWETKDVPTARYLENYVAEWWSAVAAHLAAAGRPMDRPPDLTVLEGPRGSERILALPERWGILCLVPPSWVVATAFDDVDWRLPREPSPTISENLPVSEVSWFDAVAFAIWASDVLGLRGKGALRLPFDGEWIRAATGDLPDHKWPWGDQPYLYACNSANFGKRQPLPVDFIFNDAPGWTVEGLFGMAGNVGEWTHPGEPPEEGAPPYSHASWFGGSFDRDLDDCTVLSEESRDKFRRFYDVGFRLAASPAP